MDTYFKISTVYFKGEKMDQDFSGRRLDNWHTRPAHVRHMIGGVVISEAWYTSEEICNKFPEIAKKYSF